MERHRVFSTLVTGIDLCLIRSRKFEKSGELFLLCSPFSAARCLLVLNWLLWERGLKWDGEGAGAGRESSQSVRMIEQPG